MSEKKRKLTPEEQKERMLRQKKRILARTRRLENHLCGLNIGVIVAVLAVITLFMTFGERPKISEVENRDLEKCPTFTWESYFSGDFTAQYAKFYNDTVPLRSTFKTVISQFRANLGIGGDSLHGGIPDIETRPERPPQSSTSSKKPPAVVIPQQSSSSTASSGSTPVTSSSTTSMSSSASSSTDKEPVTIDPNGGMTSSGVLVLSDGRGLSLFGGSWSGGQAYAEHLNAYKRALGDVNVYSLVSPTAVSFYLPDEYSNMTASEWDHIDNINDYLDGVIPVDAYSALEQHTAEDIFMRTDHHWSSLGAYYAAQAFAETAQVDFAELNDENYEKISRDGYLGKLYGWSGENATMRDHPETFTYYRPQNEYTADFYTQALEYQYRGLMMLDIDRIENVSEWYIVNICGDNYAVDINTDCHNGRRLMIVKDSYGNALPAFLTNSFEEIWVVDMRYFEGSVTALCQSEGITDLLFAMNSTSATGVNKDNLPNIM
ncbi:MAG: hypothetical protein K2N38_07435 [Oscillospiraceae bacterium]|nr:hypothetical protein [Oscillospiraceae bacterium]